MIMKSLVNILACIMLMCSAIAPVHAQSSSWWEEDIWANPERGFNWYPPDEVPEPKKETKEKSAPAAKTKTAKPKNIREMESVDAIHAEWKRLRDQAILQPNEKNIYAYLDANQWVQDRAQYFQDMWRRVTWKNPDVDYNNRNPNANFAQAAMKDLKSDKANNIMGEMAKTHGIVFFFKSDCDFCHIQAPILKMMQARYGMEVLAISMDRGGIKEFPQAKPDNGISMFVSQGRGIEVFPSVYLVSKNKKEVVPLGSGVLAMDEIVERIAVLTSTQPGQDF